jgi:hypothetical protein
VGRIRKKEGGGERTKLTRNRLLLLGGNSLGLEHTLDNVGLLDQEGSGDPTEATKDIIHQPTRSPQLAENAKATRRSPVLDTSGTPRSTVSPLDGLLPLGEGSVLPGSESGDTGESETTVTTLGSVLSSSQHQCIHLCQPRGSSRVIYEVKQRARTHSQLLQVVNDQLSTGSLDDPPSGRGGVVRGTLSEGDSLGHFC